MRSHATFAALALALGLSPGASSASPVAAPPGGAGVTAVVKGPDGKTVKASLFSEAQASLPVAKAGDRVITLADLADAIGATHMARAEGKAGKKDFHAVLDRLIGVKLVVQEAQAIGLDELQETKDELAQYRELALREQLQRVALKGMKPDPAAVERHYKDAVREWKVSSALLAKEEDAKALVAAAQAGKPFDELVKQAVAAKKATGGGSAQVISNRQQVLPEVLQALQALKPGQVSAPVKVDKGWAVIRLQQYLYPDRPAARAEAQKKALAEKKAAALKEFYAGLVKKYAKTDEKLLKELDFEAEKPGIAELEKDQRVITSIEGGGKITVSDMTEAAKSAFYHGVKEAIAQHKVNSKKFEFHDALLSRELVRLEVEKRKLAATPEYQRALAEHRDQTLFGKFLERVLLPDVKATEGDAKRYYEAHKAEFTYPAFYSVVSLAFTSAKAAQSAADKLKMGTDLKWLKTNADGQVPVGKRLFELDGGTLSENGMTPEVAAAVKGASTGEVRVMAQGGQHFVLLVKQATPPTPQPYPEARTVIADKVQGEMVQAAFEQWVAKLRKAHEVKVYITQITG